MMLMELCPGCGAAVRPGDGSCPECGARLEGATESFPAVAEAALAAYGIEFDASDVPVLVVLKGAEVGERFYLERPEVSIGRDPGSDIFLNDVTVSRHHALVRVSENGVSIEDTGSLNGTYINDTLVETATLSNGDVLQVGRFQMMFIGPGGA
jgi:hypothetical protein